MHLSTSQGGLLVFLTLSFVICLIPDLFIIKQQIPVILTMSKTKDIFISIENAAVLKYFLAFFGRLSKL